MGHRKPHQDVVSEKGSSQDVISNWHHFEAHLKLRCFLGFFMGKLLIKKKKKREKEKKGILKKKKKDASIAQR